MTVSTQNKHIEYLFFILPLYAHTQLSLGKDLCSSHWILLPKLQTDLLLSRRSKLNVDARWTDIIYDIQSANSHYEQQYLTVQILISWLTKLTISAILSFT
jgi:hypothetical protein